MEEEEPKNKGKKEIKAEAKAKGKKGEKAEAAEEDEEVEEGGEEEEEEEEEESKGKMKSEEDRQKGQKAALKEAASTKGGGNSKKALKKALKGMDKQRDGEYGVTRGVDFKGVDVVVNFDLPRTLRAYTHRVGRTARAGQSGTALSLVAPGEVARIEGLAAKQAARGLSVVQPLPFNLSQVTI